MKEVSLAVREAYVQALRGNITYNGSIVPVYGKVVPVDAALPYIYIASQTSSNASSKDCFSNEHNINVEAVYRSIDGSGEWVTEEISNNIKEIIAQLYQAGYPTIDSNFWFVEIEFTDDNELVQKDDTHWIFRKIISFRNIIDQE